MKKILLIPALLGTLAFATDYKYELSPMIGYNFAEGNLGIKNDINNGGYPVFGLELQANTPDSKLSPELSFFYSQGVNYLSGAETKIVRGMFNGVYTFDAEDSVTPFVKAGAGYEKLSVQIVDNENGFFFDAGAGVKVALIDQLALKLEALYMAKPSTNNSGFADNNLMALVGLSYSFGATEQKPAPVAKKVAPVVVDGDDDRDGIPNSKDKCSNTPRGAKVNASGCKLDNDSDGVVDYLDKCPNTPRGTKVNASGCEPDDDYDGVTNAQDECPNTEIDVQVDTKGCDLDNDKDGVLNAQDKCANTPLGGEVNDDGCPQKITLKVHFENDSEKLTGDSAGEIQAFADFLNLYTNYSTRIVGYTDSRGSAVYNQKLSQRRAQAVVAELTKKGVNPKQITSLGKGEADPIASNMLKEGRAKNRRVEAELIRK